MDASKQRWDSDVVDALLQLAEEAGVPQAIADQFGGAPINHTEGRAVMHMALRGQASDAYEVDGQDVMPGVLEVRGRMLDFVDRVHEAHAQGRVTDVVNNGIGGSDLGPAMACKALRKFHGGPRTHFVSNVDGAHIEAVLAELNPATATVVVVSKTFTTQETMANAAIAKAWLEAGGATLSNNSWRCPPTWRPRKPSACFLRRRSGLRIGWVAGIPCGDLWACALRWRLAEATLSCFWKVPVKWTRPTRR